MPTWRQKHLRAVDEARRALLLETGERLVVAIIVAILAIGLLWLFGSHEMAESDLFVRVASTTAIVLVFPLVYVWKLISLSSIGTWARRRLNPWLVVTLLGAMAVAVGLAGYLWDISRGPIIWTWNETSPLIFWRQGHEPLLLDGFNIKGRNRSQDGIRIAKTFIRLENLQEIPLSLIKTGQLVPAEGQVIKSGDNFSLHSKLIAINPAWTGQQPFAEAFKAAVPRFTFVFEYGSGSPYIIRFERSDIERYITAAEAANVVLEPNHTD